MRFTERLSVCGCVRGAEPRTPHSSERRVVGRVDGEVQGLGREQAQATIEPGSKVRVRDQRGHERVVTVRDESIHNPASVSTESPLGRALLGHHVGDEVSVVLARAIPARKFTITAID